MFTDEALADSTLGQQDIWLTNNSLTEKKYDFLPTRTLESLELTIICWSNVFVGKKAYFLSAKLLLVSQMSCQPKVLLVKALSVNIHPVALNKEILD